MTRLIVNEWSNKRKVLAAELESVATLETRKEGADSSTRSRVQARWLTLADNWKNGGGIFEGNFSKWKEDNRVFRNCTNTNEGRKEEGCLVARQKRADSSNRAGFE